MALNSKALLWQDCSNLKDVNKDSVLYIQTLISLNLPHIKKRKHNAEYGKDTDQKTTPTEHVYASMDNFWCRDQDWVFPKTFVKKYKKIDVLKSGHSLQGKPFLLF